MLSMMLCPTGPSAAPAIPWITRNTTICSMLPASPHITEAATNRPTLSRNSRRMPSRSASQPLTGVAMAEAMM